jgi:DNA-binding XRE family transcriptional regulator
LAKRIYASPQTVNYYVDGRRMPSVETALRIAKALGVKVEDIWLL